MNAPKITGGNWRVGELYLTKNKEHIPVMGEFATIVLTNPINSIATKEDEANATLIAAAPDLAKALERCISSFESSKTGGFNGHGNAPENGSSYVLAKQALLKAGYTE